jgi:hypothetical protein
LNQTKKSKDYFNLALEISEGMTTLVEEARTLAWQGRKCAPKAGRFREATLL